MIRQSFLAKKLPGADCINERIKFRIICHLLRILYAIDIKGLGQSSGCDIANDVSDWFLSSSLLNV